MPSYSPASWERTMRAREVILHAIAGKMTWLQAADVMGMIPRTLRRRLGRMEHFGVAAHQRLSRLLASSTLSITSL